MTAAATENLAKGTVNLVNTLVLTALLISASDLHSLIFFFLYYLLIWAPPALSFYSGLNKRKKKLLLPWIVVIFIQWTMPGVACIVSSLQGEKLHFYTSDLEGCCSVSFLSLTGILAVTSGTLTSLVYCKMEKPPRTTEPDILGELQTLRETTTEMNPQLRVDISGERVRPSTTTTTSVVRLSDTQNGEGLPPSYSQIVDIDEDLPSYIQASYYNNKCR